MQQTWVQSLVHEDSTSRTATKPLCHNYWTCALEPMFRNKRSHLSEKPMRSPRSTTRVAPAHWNQRIPVLPDVFIWPDVSFLIFCLDNLLTDVSGVVKSPTVIVLLSVSPFRLLIYPLCIWCSYVGYIFIYKCCFFLLDWPLCYYVMPFFVFCSSLFCLIWV